MKTKIIKASRAISGPRVTDTAKTMPIIVMIIIAKSHVKKHWPYSELLPKIRTASIKTKGPIRIEIIIATAHGRLPTVNPPPKTFASSGNSGIWNILAHSAHPLKLYL